MTTLNTVRVVRTNGRTYGLRVIGGENSHNRYRTPDGKKHRSIKGAVAHLDSVRRQKLVYKVNMLKHVWGIKVA